MNVYLMKQFNKISKDNHMYTRRSQSIKIGTDLSIDKSIKISKFDLIDIDRIDQLVEIDDTLICFIDFS